MINIRNGVFETNSSSVHTITICQKNDYDKWANGETYFTDDGNFITIEEAKSIVDNERKKWHEPPIDWDNLSTIDIEDILKENEIFTIENYGYDEYEWYEEEYTTKSGDTIVAFGYYGHD